MYLFDDGLAMRILKNGFLMMQSIHTEEKCKNIYYRKVWIAKEVRRRKYEEWKAKAFEKSLIGQSGMRSRPYRFTLLSTFSGTPIVLVTTFFNNSQTFQPQKVANWPSSN